MAKTNKIKSNKKKSGEIRTSKTAKAVQARVLGGMDEAAKAYARLLADPCNATLAKPIYMGSGSGYMTRIRYRFAVGTNTQFVFQFIPSALHTGSGIMYASSTGGQSAVGFQNAAAGAYFGSLLGVVKSYRPVAACVKVIYTGAESTRAGELGMLTSSENILPTVLPVSVVPPNYMNQCPAPSRLGMDVHEVRWAPTVPDQDFTDVDEVADVKGGAMLVVGDSCPASSIVFEYTVVIEWIPNGSTGLVANYSVPPSRNSVNEVLRALGPTASWAYGRVKDAVMTSITPTALNVARQLLPHAGAMLAAI